MHNYLKSALIDKKIQYLGDGSEIREYIHVSDASRLGIDVLDQEYENKTLIITGHNPTNVKDLFRMIQEIIGGDIDIEYNFSPQIGKKKSHYKITPYFFNQNMPRKLTSNQYVDLGVGILEMLEHLKQSKK
jgi:UDP-glucose 4-epimerase